MFGRRFLTMGGAAAAALPWQAATAQAQAGRPMLVFVGDQASAACKTWRTQWEPLFVASEAYKRLDYRVVYPATAALVLKPASWPADLRWVLDTFLMSEVGVEQGAETPRFFLIQNRQITFTTLGNSGWREVMWPTLLDVTGTKG